MKRVNISRIPRVLIALFAAIVLLVSVIPVAANAETTTTDYYSGQLANAKGFGAGQGAAASVQELYDSTDFTPTLFSPWANWKWDATTISGHTSSKNVYLVLSDNHVLETGDALLFYVKLPEDAPETTIGFRFSDQTVNAEAGVDNRNTYVTLTAGSAAYLMPKATQQWTQTTVINDTGYTAANDVVFPAGFEGWVRIPYESFNLAAQGWTTLDNYRVRMYLKSVDNSFADDGLCMGAFAVVDNGTSNLDKIRVNDNNTPVRLFPKTYTQETADTAIVVNKSFETLPAEDGILGNNPDRGFRSEEKYELSATEIARVAALTDAELQAEIKKETQVKTRGESPMVSRVYFKMQPYAAAAAIPAEAQAYMNRILAAYKALGIRTYITIYYMSDPTPENPETAPTINTILAHMDQYKTVLATSKDAVAALCFGLIGEDGEWDYEDDSLDATTQEIQSVVTKMLTDTLPADMYLTLRKPLYKETYVEPLLAAGTITQDRFNRIGFDQAAMFGLERGNGTWKPGNAEWNYGMQQAPYAYNDAETFVTKYFYENNYNNGQIFIGNSALQSLSQQWTATLSAYHANGDHGSTYTYEDTNFYYWKNHADMKITADTLTTMGLPFTANWFKDENGNTVTRSVYDYLRDYLGYRLSMKQLSVTGGESIGQTIRVNAVLNNYGYAAPVTMTESGFVILDEDGNVVSSIAVGTPAQWYSTNPAQYTQRTQLDHTINATMTLPEEIGTYRLAFYLRNSAGQPVRLDNTTPYENGYQILHTFEVVDKDFYTATMATIGTPNSNDGKTGTLVSNNDSGLTPSVPSDWAKWIWTDLATHNATPGAQCTTALTGLTPSNNSALLFYLKMPANTSATQMGVRIQNMSGNRDINANATVYLLPKNGETWEGKTATKATATVAGGTMKGVGYFDIPAEFEGWVRIPCANTALETDVALKTLRIFLLNVDENYTTDYFCAGAVSLVNEGRVDHYKLSSDGGVTVLPLVYYAAAMSADTTLYYSADRTRLGGTYEAYTAPTADTPNILGGFLRIGANGSSTGVVRLKVDQVFTFDSADQALMFYIKTPSGEGATATDIKVYANVDVSQPLINNQSYYLLDKTDGIWSTETIASNQIALPAGFEGWVRIPYGSFNNMTAATYDQFTRFNFANVSAGDYYIGAVSIVDNISRYNIKVNDSSTVLPMFR